MEYSALFARRKKLAACLIKARCPKKCPDRPRAILAQHFIARRAPRPIVHRSATLSRHGAKRHFSSASAGGKSAHKAERGEAISHTVAKCANGCCKRKPSATKQAAHARFRKARGKRSAAVVVCRGGRRGQEVIGSGTRNRSATAQPPMKRRTSARNRSLCVSTIAWGAPA